MPTTTDCPSCGRRLWVPDGLGQTRAQCPSCGRSFAVGAEPSVPDPAEELPEEQSIAPGNRPGLSLSLGADDSAPAHVVGVPPPPPPLRAVPVAASSDPQLGQLRRDCEPHRCDLVLALGILSLVMLVFCPFLGLPSGLAAWFMGEGDLGRMRTDRMDSSGSGLTRAGLYCGMIGTILNGLVVIGVATIGLGLR